MLYLAAFIYFDEVFIMRVREIINLLSDGMVNLYIYTMYGAAFYPLKLYYKTLSLVDLFSGTKDYSFEVAKSYLDYIESRSQPLQFLVGEGYGFGDQAIVAKLIRGLEKYYNYRGVIHVVGPYSEKNPESPLYKIMQLFGVNTPLFSDKLTTTLSNGQVITFIDYKYFIDNAFQTELAIFAGAPEFLFSTYKIRAYRIMGGKYTLNDLSKLGQARCALFFDVFTMRNQPHSGFKLQCGNDSYTHYSSAEVLSYKSVLPSPEEVKEALITFAQINPYKAAITAAILEGQASNRMAMFAMYGLNAKSYPNQAENLRHLVPAILKALPEIGVQQETGVVILLLNKMLDDAWNKLIQYFSGAELQRLFQLTGLNDQPTMCFVRAGTHNETLSPHCHLTLLEISSLPQSIFDWLVMKSIMTLYEGENLATYLREGVKKFGLPCKKPTAAFMIDAYTLPRELINAGRYVCTTQGENVLDVERIDKITDLIIRYANETRVVENLPDRFSVGLAKAGLASPSGPTLFKPAHSYTWLELHTKTGLTQAACGSAEEITRQILTRGFHLSPSYVEPLSYAVALSMQFGIELSTNQQSSSLSLLFYLMSLAMQVSPLSQFNKKWIPVALFIILSLVQVGADFDAASVIYAATSMAVAIGGRSVGRYGTGYMISDRRNKASLSAVKQDNIQEMENTVRRSLN